MTVGIDKLTGAQSYRPFDVKRDSFFTLVGLAIGLLVGLVSVTMIVVLFQGLWILVLLALPILVLQLFMQEALLWLWRKVFGRGKPDPKQDHSAVRQAFDVDPAPEPPAFLRAHAFKIGMVVGALFALISLGGRYLGAWA